MDEIIKNINRELGKHLIDIQELVNTNNLNIFNIVSTELENIKKELLEKNKRIEELEKILKKDEDDLK